MSIPRFLVIFAPVAGILASIPFVSAYLDTKIDDGGASVTTTSEIFEKLETKWNLVHVESLSDLGLLIGNDRIAKIEMRRSSVQHSSNAPQDGLIIRVYTSDLTGRISRWSFVAFLDDTGEVQHVAKITSQ